VHCRECTPLPLGSTTTNTTINKSIWAFVFLCCCYAGLYKGGPRLGIYFSFSSTSQILSWICFVYCTCHSGETLAIFEQSGLKGFPSRSWFPTRLPLEGSVREIVLRAFSYLYWVSNLYLVPSCFFVYSFSRSCFILDYFPKQDLTLPSRYHARLG
jgi:hypothetical protein